MIIIDAHNHIGTRAGTVHTGGELVSKMDVTGVDRAVIFPFVEGNFDNEAVREAAKQFPNRLIPFCAVNPWQSDAADEIRRCVTASGFRGLKLHPTINGFHLSDATLVDPLFRVAEELAIPVIVHGASDVFNGPAEFAVMAARFPQVPLLMAHMGFFWGVDLAIDFARQFNNLYLETSRVPVFEIRRAIQALGAEKVIWGTDSPFVDYEWEIQKMKRAAIEITGYEDIVGGNMAKLLRL
jgi:predicted TIM-barrel fold metal-dependent hydrolase